MTTTAQQADVLRQMIDLSYEKRLAITADDIDALKQCTEREFFLVSKLNQLLKSSEIPSAEVIALARELKERNKLNDDLINTHLEFVNTMITLLTPDNDPLNNYYSGDGRPLEQNLAKRPAMLDMSV